MAHLLRLAAVNHYGPEGWTCVDEAAAPGETPVGGVFIKQTCEKITPERHLSVTAHFLRKPGQRDIDPVTGEYTEGQFESWTRFELMDLRAFLLHAFLRGAALGVQTRHVFLRIG